MSEPMRAAVSAAESALTGAPRSLHCRSRSLISARLERPAAQCNEPLRTGSQSIAYLSIVFHTSAGPAAEQGQHPLAVVRAERLLDILRHEPHAGVDEPGVASRGAEADLDRLEGDDLRPRLGEPQRRREPGIAAADDRDVGANLALKRRRRRRRGSGYFPKAVRERIVLHVVEMIVSGFRCPLGSLP